MPSKEKKPPPQQQEGQNRRQNISSGTPWESKAGYSRAVRVGNLVFVAGTTSADSEGKIIGMGDPYAQARYILNKIERALKEAGATLNDVVRTRMFVTDISRFQEVARAHDEVFHDIRPAATLIEVSALQSKDMLIEIEVDAVIPAP
jgi:enamine deaminase RidA (YjgF/YER057c/UK114 family)